MEAEKKANTVTEMQGGQLDFSLKSVNCFQFENKDFREEKKKVQDHLWQVQREQMQQDREKQDNTRRGGREAIQGPIYNEGELWKRAMNNGGDFRKTAPKEPK